MQVLEELVHVVNPTGRIGVVGVYFPEDPGGVDKAAKNGPDSGFPVASRPTHQTLAAFSAISVRAILTARSNGMVSSVPEAALAKPGAASQASRRRVTTTAAASTANATPAA